ncbi:transferase [Streptomyces sp. NPDC051320]|uniref:transferase n=1 Tax=Streptomyces sp. NPDC051320 TaxID=3154644 RepID=UPI003425C893
MSRTDTAPQPSADCTADAEGALTFELTVSDGTLPDGTVSDGTVSDGTVSDGTVSDVTASRPAALVLKRRSSDDRVTLALTATGDGRLRTVLSAGVELAEGRWDVFAECGSEGERRIDPGLRDLRMLVDRMPPAAARTVVARVPYRTVNGKLSLRCWMRSPHAEAGELTVRDGALTVRGQLYGSVLGAHAAVQARLRGARGHVHREAVTGDADGGFSCTLPYRPLAGDGAAESRLWDLSLLPEGPNGPEIRISRILDDLADRKSVFVYPPSFFAVTDRGSGEGDTDAGGDGRGGADPVARAAPYYTVDNDLSVRVDFRSR